VQSFRIEWVLAMTGIALLFNPIIKVRFHHAGREPDVGND
jgi:hypothetical protein